MKKTKSSTMEIASVYIGTVIGAGFASGQEIIQFFTSYGSKGIYGILLAGVIFSLLGWAILEIVYVRKINDYRNFIHLMMGEFLGNIMEWIVALFMFIIFCTMLAGTGALLRQQFHIPMQVGIFLMAGLSVIVFMYDIKGIIIVNYILAPLLLIGGILLGIYIIVFRDVAVFSSATSIFRLITRNWITSSILYVSYNTITAVVILTGLLPIIHSKKEAKWGGILGGAALGVLGLCVGLGTLIYYNNIRNLEIPILGIVMGYGTFAQYVYFFVLIAAIFTTAIANGYGFLKRVSMEFKMPLKKITPLFIIASMVFAQVGFSKMVEKLYTLFGYVGIFEVLVILIYFISRKVNKIKKRILR